jgi:hypothetical protein
MDKEFQYLIDCYQRSKIVRLGTIVNESDHEGVLQLAAETGLDERVLYQYGRQVTKYFPYATRAEFLREAKEKALHEPELPPAIPYRYTAEEDAAVVSAYAYCRQSRKLLDDYLPTVTALKNRTVASIKSRAAKLGVTRQRWTPRENQIIYTHYPSLGKAGVANILGNRSAVAVQVQACMLDVKKVRVFKN